MRKFVTGVDADGRSCIVEEGPLVPSPDPTNPAFAFALAATTTTAPPPARPEGRGNRVDLGVAPGMVTWMIVDYPPDVDFPMHHSDTIDFDTLLEGSLELVLDRGGRSLEPGDVVVVNGVDHGWRTGPEGCRLSVCMIGTPPLP